MKIIKTFSLLLLTGFIFLIYQNIMAFRTGITGFTKKNGNTTGCVCHELEPNDTVSVIIRGPASVHANDSAIYILSIAKGPAISGGCDIATSRGTLFPSVIDTSLKREEQIPGSGYELTHKEPKLFTGDTLKFYFKYVAPSTPNVTDTIFANGNSTNNNSSSDNDKWNYAANFLINILPSVGIAENNIQINSFKLSQNYPNPFNPATKINYVIPSNVKGEWSNVKLVIYNSLGMEVKALVNETQSAGNYEVTFSGDNLPSGVYFYKLTAGNFSATRQMILLK